MHWIVEKKETPDGENRVPLHQGGYLDNILSTKQLLLVALHLGKSKRSFFRHYRYSDCIHYQCPTIAGWTPDNNSWCFYPVSARATFVNMLLHVLPLANSCCKKEYKLIKTVHYCPITSSNQWYFRSNCYR